MTWPLTSCHIFFASAKTMNQMLEKRSKRWTVSSVHQITLSSVFTLRSVYFTLDIEPKSFLTPISYRNTKHTNEKVWILSWLYIQCISMRKAEEVHDNTDLITNLLLSSRFLKIKIGDWAFSCDLCMMYSCLNHTALLDTHSWHSEKTTSGHSNNLVRCLRHPIVKAG